MPKKKKEPIGSSQANIFQEPLFKNFIAQLSAGFFLFDQNGRMIISNKMGEKLLGEKQIRKSELKNQVGITLQTEKELMRDLPGKDRVFRCRTEYLVFNDNRVFCLATLRDVSDEWRLERQRIILEYTAHSLSQNISTQKWLTSILKKVNLVMKTKNCVIYLLNRPEKELKKTAWAFKTDSPSKLKVGQGAAGKAAKNKSYVLTHKNKQDGSNSPTLYLPMLVDDYVIGVLQIQNKPEDFFRYPDLTFYTTLANRLAMAIEHKSLVDELDDTQNKLKTVLDNTEHGVLLLDQKNNILLANSSFANLIGHRKHHLIGEDLQKILPELGEFLKKEKVRHREIELSSLPEKQIVKINRAAIKESDNEETVLSVQNITDEKMLEQMKNDFVSTATHELRTPLTAVLGYLSILAKQTDNLDDKQKLYLSRINIAAENLAMLIEELLSVLRLEQDRADLLMKPNDLRELTKKVITDLEVKMQKKNIKVQLPIKNHKILTDEHAFQRVFSNLVDNAVKYSYPNTKIKIIYLPFLQKNKPFLRIDVIDAGVGIPANKQNQLFEKFNRIPNKFSIEAGGTGLGLYISKMLVNKWGGNIFLTKSNREGSTFSFTVPLA